MIEGVKVIDLKSFVDDRGYLVQLFDGGLEIKRGYTVNNFDKGTIRAFHKNFDEWKYFLVPKGSAMFVLFSDKDAEPQKIILSSKKPQMLVIPPGIWNGWKALENNTILIGFSDKTMKEHKDERCNPFKFGKEIWEVKSR